MSNKEDVEHSLVSGNSEIYWDGSTEDIVVIGPSGDEERISLARTLADNGPEMRATLIEGYFWHTVQHAASLKLGAPPEMEILGTVELDPETGDVVGATGMMRDVVGDMGLLGEEEVLGDEADNVLPLTRNTKKDLN